MRKFANLSGQEPTTGGTPPGGPLGIKPVCLFGQKATLANSVFPVQQASSPNFLPESLIREVASLVPRFRAGKLTLRAARSAVLSSPGTAAQRLRFDCTAGPATTPVRCHSELRASRFAPSRFASLFALRLLLRNVVAKRCDRPHSRLKFATLRADGPSCTRTRANRRAAALASSAAR